MVSYFYEAGYKVSTYSTCEPLLHVQIAIMADKYVCASLYELARSSFANTINAVDAEAWSVIAAFVYDYTTDEITAHRELRALTVGAVANRHSALKLALRCESVTKLLRENADLATDILEAGRHGSKGGEFSEHIFICDHCRYTHIGSSECSQVTCTNIGGMRTCPQCKKGDVQSYQRYVAKVNMYEAIFCPFCDGFHNENTH